MSISALVLELWQFPFIRDSNSEVGNTTVWVLPNIWVLEQVWYTKFGTNVSNKILLNAANWQGYNSYRFWVIKGKPTRRRGVTPTSTTQIRVNDPKLPLDEYLTIFFLKLLGEKVLYFGRIWNVIFYWIFRIFGIFWVEYWTGGNLPLYALASSK